MSTTTSESRDALLWLCQWPFGCRSLTHSAHCGSVWSGTCWVDVRWQRPGFHCSPVLLLGVDVGGSVDVDGGVKLWTPQGCCFGEEVQTGLMGKPGPWMDPGVPVCPGYPVGTKIYFKKKRHLEDCIILHFLSSTSLPILFVSYLGIVFHALTTHFGKINTVYLHTFGIPTGWTLLSVLHDDCHFSLTAKPIIGSCYIKVVTIANLVN